MLCIYNMGLGTPSEIRQEKTCVASEDGKLLARAPEDAVGHGAGIKAA